MEVMPVTSIDSRKVGNGRPGPMTRRLHELFVASQRRFSEP
jgi:branched-subunit amino acid aminotransferase/4-amino-4-deoxychorismate lyase